MTCRAEPGTAPRFIPGQRPLTPIEKVNKASPGQKSAPMKPQPTPAVSNNSSGGGHKPSPSHLASPADIFAAADELGIGGMYAESMCHLMLLTE